MFGNTSLMDRTPVRYGRRRFLAATAVIAVLLPVARAAAGPAGGTHAARSHTYVVQAGDTLWGIAQDQELAGDPRAGVQILLRSNPSAAALQPGMALRIPAE